MSQRGQEILRTYLTKLHGIGGLVTYLDAYFSIQEWKKLPSTADTFESKALNILEVRYQPCTCTYASLAVFAGI